MALPSRAGQSVCVPVGRAVRPGISFGELGKVLVTAIER